jgi:hypothetical protein
MVDFIATFDTLLYAGNSGSTKALPNDDKSSPSDWSASSPGTLTLSYTLETSVATSKTSDLQPADRAWPRVAAYNGKLYAARNTTNGPQLWKCTPTSSACGPSDWSLLAEDNALTPLTRFDVTTRSAISMLVANGKYLYVGFDDASAGVAIYRTSVADPSAKTDFASFGGPFGAVQITDAIALPYEGNNWLYVAVRNGTAGPLRIFREMD